MRVPLLTYGDYEHPQNVCLLVTISSFASSSAYEDTYGYSWRKFKETVSQGFSFLKIRCIRVYHKTEQLPDEHIPGIYLPSTFILIWLKSEGN